MIASSYYSGEITDPVWFYLSLFFTAIFLFAILSLYSYGVPEMCTLYTFVLYFLNIYFLFLNVNNEIIIIAQVTFAYTEAGC